MNKLLLFAALCLLAQPCAFAQQSADDQYVSIYSLIQQADALNEKGVGSEALAKYKEAEAALKKFQGEFPTWNPKIISFRLDYITTKVPPLESRLRNAPAPRPATTPPPAVTPPPVTKPPPVAADTDSQIKAQLAALQEQIRQVQAEKASLEQKLNEAAARPPVVDTAAVTKAEGQAQTLQRENEQLKASADQQARTLAAARLEAATLQSRLEALNNSQAIAETGRNQTLQEQIRKLETDNSLLQTKLSEAAARPPVVDTAALTKAGGQIQTLQRENEQLKASVDQQVKDLAVARSETVTLQSRLEALANSRTAAETAQSRTVQEQIQRLEADNALLQAKLKEALAAQPAALDPRQLARAEERITQLQQENDSLKANLERRQATVVMGTDTPALEQAKLALAEANRKLAEQVQSATSWDAERKALQNRVESLTVQSDALTGARAENESLKKQVAELRQADSSAMLQKTQQALDESNRKLQQQVAMADSLAREKETLQQRLNALPATGPSGPELEQAKLALAEANRKLAEQVQSATSWDAERKALQSRVESLAAQSDALTGARAENESLKKQVAELRQADSSALLQKTQQALDESNRKLQQQVALADGLAREKDTLQTRVESLAAQGEALNTARAENESLKKQVAELRQADSSALLQKTQQALDESNRKLQQQVALADGLAREKETLQQRLNALPPAGPPRELEEARQALAAANSKLAQQTEAAVLLIVEANTKQEQQEKIAGTLTQQNEALQKRLQTVTPNAEAAAALRAENEILKKQLAAAASKPATSSAEPSSEQLSQAQVKLAALQSDLEVLRLEKAALEQRVKQTSAPATAMAKPVTSVAPPAPKPVTPVATSKPVTPVVTPKPVAPKSVTPVVTPKPVTPVATSKPVSPVVTPKPATPVVAPKPAPSETPTADQAQKMKLLEQQREELQKRLNEALNQAGLQSYPSQTDQMTNQLTVLRARVDVLEAKPVPYTAEELSLMKQPETKLAMASAPNTGTARPGSKKELPASAGKLLAEAQRFFATRQFDKAEENYRQVLRQDDQNVFTLANLASIQIEQNRLDEAEINLKKALAIEPNDAYSLTAMGNLKFRQQKYDEALDVLSRAAQLDPKSAEVQNFLGITLSHKGQRGPAETALRKAIQISPGYGAAHNNLAVIYATQSPPSLELARWHYQKALAAGQPANPDLEKLLDRAPSAKPNP